MLTKQWRVITIAYSLEGMPARLLGLPHEECQEGSESPMVQTSMLYKAYQKLPPEIF
jgi:hypothetical protein